MDLLLGISLSKTINNNCHDGPLPLQLAFLFITKAKASMQTIISHSLTSVRLSHFSFPRLPTCFPECQTMFFNTIKWLIIPCFFSFWTFTILLLVLFIALYTLYFILFQTSNCACIQYIFMFVYQTSCTCYYYYQFEWWSFVGHNLHYNCPYIIHI